MFPSDAKKKGRRLLCEKKDCLGVARNRRLNSGRTESQEKKRGARQRLKGRTSSSASGGKKGRRRPSQERGRRKLTRRKHHTSKRHRHRQKETKPHLHLFGGKKKRGVQTLTGNVKRKRDLQRRRNLGTRKQGDRVTEKRPVGKDQYRHGKEKKMWDTDQ